MHFLRGEALTVKYGYCDGYLEPLDSFKDYDDYDEESYNETLRNCLEKNKIKFQEKLQAQIYNLTGVNPRIKNITDTHFDIYYS
jgi:hypothetical protein